jgi:hypothetical protein
MPFVEPIRANAISPKELFDRATNYTRIILGIGYAGVFAGLAAMKDSLAPLLYASAAFLVAISLFVYVAYTIVEMLYLNLALLRLPIGWIRWAWFVAFTVAAGAGFAAGTIVLYAYGLKIWVLL